MQLRLQLVARWSSALAVLGVLSWVLATTPTAGWTWTVAVVAVVGVLTSTALRRLVPTSAPAVRLRVRDRGHETHARQSAPGRPGRPQPRAPGTRPRASILLPAGSSTG